MAIIVQAMTSLHDGEIRDCLNVLGATTAGTGLMHESFNGKVSTDDACSLPEISRIAAVDITMIGTTLPYHQ